ncbi:unnamed protein product [Nezara viridula]|uniref:Uncharacterized protein n=1 Tax=Nezara viridula TaxID=85310 RepID=A0A9P0H7S0_NEZVI|nr:unnamed protein product [Nezara viridula]
MLQPPSSSPFIPNISAERHKEIGRSEEGSLAMGALAAAAQLGDFKTVKKLLEIGVDKDFMPDLDSKERNTLLDSINIKLDNIEQLIEGGLVSIPSLRTVKKGPFAKGMFKIIFIPGTEFVMHLMIETAMMGSWNPSNNSEGFYPLHYFCSLPDIPTGAINDLLDLHPVDINEKTLNGFTALIIAVARKNFPVVKFLIEKGALLNYAPIVKIAIDELGSYYPYLKVFSPVKVTFPQMHYYFSPVEAAVFANEQDILCYLVKKGAKVIINQGLWNTLIHPIVRGRRRLVEMLLDNGVDVNVVDLMGTSSLHKAAMESSIDLTYVLMRRGANVNAQDRHGWTPLHIACLFSRNVSLEIIQLLLDGGADIEATTEFGFTPLCLAEAGNDLFFLGFLAENMDKLGKGLKEIYMPEEDTRKEHEDIMTLLLDNGASCNHQDDHLGWTALHWAAASGDLRTTQLLVSRGAKVSIRSRFNFNPYQTALYFNRGPVSAYLFTVTDEAKNK